MGSQLLGLLALGFGEGEKRRGGKIRVERIGEKGEVKADKLGRERSRAGRGEVVKKNGEGIREKEGRRGRPKKRERGRGRNKKEK